MYHENIYSMFGSKGTDIDVTVELCCSLLQKDFTRPL